MAGQSQKKSQKVHSELIIKYKLFFYVSQIIYNVYQYFFGDIYCRTQQIQSIFLFIMGYFTMNYIDKSLLLGLDIKSYTYYNDVFILNGVVQLGSLFSPYFWYLYAIIPVILIFKFLSFVLSFFSSAGKQDNQEESQQMSKRQQKLQEREKKGKNVRYM